MAGIVVVGAGLAGMRTAVELRQRGYDGQLTLLGAESRPPYDRPPLSKAVLLGHEEESTLSAEWSELDVSLRLGVRALGLAPGVLETSVGPLEFDGLVLGTGSAPTRPRGLSQALVLRTHEDALRLRAALVPGARVVVVGAGWLGAEVASAAAARGCAVTVVEALMAPLARVLPAEVGARTAPWYDEAGVRLLLGAPVAGVNADGVHLADGRCVPADVVVAATGVRAATGWLVGSPVPLAADGAVVVDVGLRTGVPGVYAVGDCAAWPSTRFGVRLHVEHWDNAMHAPAVAAANLLGGDEIHDPVPSFWSEQFGHMLQQAGHAGGGERVLTREHGPPGWSVLWLRDDRLVAVVTVDRPRELVQARRLVAAGVPVDPTRLADPGVEVRDAVR